MGPIEDKMAHELYRLNERLVLAQSQMRKLTLEFRKVLLERDFFREKAKNSKANKRYQPEQASGERGYLQEVLAIVEETNRPRVAE
jgi:hypothetical protein